MRLRMAVPWLLLVLVVACAWPDSASAQARKITKEPAYQQTQQQYLLLLLGQKPLREIWIVRDGMDFYIDRNANGDLTDADEKITAQKPTLGTYFNLDFGMIRDAHGVAHGPLQILLTTNADAESRVTLPIAKKFTQMAFFVPARTKPAAASVLHFDGPLTSGFLGSDQSRRVPSSDPKWLTLSRSKPRLLAAWVGTQVKDSPAVSCVTFSVTQEKDEKRPQLKIAYENRDPKGPPIVESHILEEETLTIFSKRVRAPMDSGAKARYTLTFPALAEVPGYEIEVKVVD